MGEGCGRRAVWAVGGGCVCGGGVGGGSGRGAVWAGAVGVDAGSWACIGALKTFSNMVRVGVDHSRL